MARRARRHEPAGASLFAPSDEPEEPAHLPIQAGLDEAGFGPLLGPLAIGAVVLRRARPAEDPWDVLAPPVGRADERDPARLCVGDSKAVFERTPRGRARLERTVLAFHAMRHGLAADGRAFLATTAAPLALPEVAHEFWHARLPARLADHEPGALERACAELAAALARAHTEVLACDVRLVPPRALNASFARTGSKGATHWEQCAPFLARVWQEHAAEGVDLVVDRHGGRMRYADLLARTFVGARVTVLGEAPARSLYRLDGPGGRVLRATFAEKADAQSFPVALASCCAKYAREIAMAAFNAHFASFLPGLAPTAGYVTDARRWLADAGPALAAAGLRPEDLVRTR